MMRSYDDWRTSAPEEDGGAPVECSVCTGHAYAAPCGEDCAELVARCERERLIKVLYANAWRALELAREYRREAQNDDHRVREILHRVGIIRVDIAELRRAS